MKNYAFIFIKSKKEHNKLENILWEISYYFIHLSNKCYS